MTAQKREETNQEIPLSITALTEDTLIKQGIQGTGDLLGKMPGIGGMEAPGSKESYGAPRTWGLELAYEF